jgi:hypothetical protein
LDPQVQIAALEKTAGPEVKKIVKKEVLQTAPPLLDHL